MKRRSLPIAAALVATAALLLTACGGEDGKYSGNGKVTGAEPNTAEPKNSADPSATSPKDKCDGVDVSLPADVNLVFDWNKPKAKNEAAAMDDAANYLRAIYKGVDDRTAEGAAVTAYSTGDGLHYAQVQIGEWIKGGWTATGTQRHYDASTRSATNGNSVEVSFCTDASKFFGKEIRTKKILTTEPSISDFDHFKIIMVKFPTRDGLWQASKVFVETKAAKCR
ncbi:hypothetical protein ACFW9L_19420 [Streptomyces sp. NPDC059517]|uniref:hypothetical protein n=1 Tax=Streptomyces sp. NPDC059517 TaxID=3346855 RepID=UPI00367DC348